MSDPGASGGHKGGKAGAGPGAGDKGKGGGKENEPETPRGGVAFEVNLGAEEKPKAPPPARLQEQIKEKGSVNLTKEELEKKLEEAEKRRSQVQEQRLDRIKDISVSGFIGKPEVPPEDPEIKE